MRNFCLINEARILFSSSGIKKQCLRFRRWSRKSYAVFGSLGRHVTIGNLKTIVADRLLGKQENSHTLLLYEEKQPAYKGRQTSCEEPPDDLFLADTCFIPALNYSIDNYKNVNHIFCKELLCIAESSVFKKRLSAFLFLIYNQIT